MPVRIPAKAPAGEITLKLLPPMSAATIPAHAEVISPMIGDAPDAMANESERGTETTAIERPDFQLEAMFLSKLFMIEI